MRMHAGFSYIGVLFTLMIAAIGMQGAALMWQHQAQRIKEAELLEVGEAYRLAIGRYYELTPKPVPEYPESLAALLEDRRFPVPKRHLRKMYSDPFFVNHGMQLIIRRGRIVGVYSQSKQAPIRHHGYQESQVGFSAAKSYRDWRFEYTPGTLTALEAAWPKRQF